MKNTKDNIFKRWWKLCNPNKKYFLGQVFFYVGYTIFLSLLTIFAARTINCMYADDWSGAFTNLLLELLTIIIRNLSMHVQYYYYSKQVDHIRTNVSKKMYKKILSCKNDEFNNVSKEKVINIALNNMANMADFPDHISSFIAYSFQVAFTLITVFVSNTLAGVIVTALGVINFFAYYLFNKKLGRIMQERFEKKDDMFKSYSKVINGKDVINESRSVNKYQKELITDVKGFNNAYKKYQMTYSFKVNIWYAIWNVVVYGIAALMLFYVSKNTLDIAVYLVIVPYLTTCTDKLNTLFDKTSALENMRVDVDRFNLILSLNDEELIEYGKLNKKSDDYKLGLIDVTCINTQTKKYDLKDANLSFITNGINVIKSEKNGGKRTIFNLLRRQIKPNQGKVLLDNLNLYDYNQKTFKTHINYCSSHPTFLDASIKENLLIVNKDFKQIKDVCKKLGILDDINRLNSGFETPINNIHSSSFIFMLGFARALLTNCKILMIYEIPQDAPESFRKQIVKFLQKFNIDKTIILFTHSDDYDEIASSIYLVKNSKVKQVKTLTDNY